MLIHQFYNSDKNNNNYLMLGYTLYGKATYLDN